MSWLARRDGVSYDGGLCKRTSKSMDRYVNAWRLHNCAGQLVWRPYESTNRGAATEATERLELSFDEVIL